MTSIKTTTRLLLVVLLLLSVWSANAVALDIDTLFTKYQPNGSGFGRNVVGIGDQNSDGYNDFLIQNGSVIEMYYGGVRMIEPEPPEPPDTVGPPRLNWFKKKEKVVSEVLISPDPVWKVYHYLNESTISICRNVGDINGDGVDDFIFSVYDNSAGPIGSEAVFIIKGNRDWVVSAPMQEEILTPQSSTITNAYPNPFNKTLSLELYIHQIGETEISFYDIKGSLVLKHQRGVLNAGNRRMELTPKDLTAGVYFIKLDVRNNFKADLMQQVRINARGIHDVMLPSDKHGKSAIASAEFCAPFCFN